MPRTSLPYVISDFYGRTAVAVYVIAQLMAEDPEGFVAEVEFRINLPRDES